MLVPAWLAIAMDIEASPNVSDLIVVLTILVAPWYLGYFAKPSNIIIQ